MGINDGKNPEEKVPDLCTSSREFFTGLVDEACTHNGFETFPQATGYLVDLLIFYMNTENLFDEADQKGRLSRGTLAEMFLKANSAQRGEKVELLKKLGDSALYISGFFGQSLQRKLVNVDYYKEMGESAYGSLAKHVDEDFASKLYDEYSRRFIRFVDILTYISSKAIRPAEENLLQLFAKYEAGSELAREELLDKGVIAAPPLKTRYSQ